MDLKDRVEQISATIRELRQAAGNGPKTRQLIDALFRTVHSFKAAALAEGATDVSRTAHEFENLLHSVRTGKVTLDTEVLRAFEDTALALLGESATSPLDRVNKLASHANSVSHELPEEFSALKDDERHRAVAAMQEGSNLYVLESAFDATDFDQRFRQLKEQLDKTAEVISTSASMKDDEVVFRVLYAAPSEKIPVQNLFDKAVLAGQTVATALGKEIEFIVLADEFLLDKIWGDVLEDALLHLVRNAVDHGIELSGRVTLQLLRTSQVRILVTDNGRGIDPANLPFLFQPGFSTAKEVSEISGRGVGLDAVKTEIEALGGNVNVISILGKFTSFVITMPNPSSDA
ncbi:MAG TPA: ATP-binding protein [Pyrinomonadaceae bacterium]